MCSGSQTGGVTPLLPTIAPGFAWRSHAAAVRRPEGVDGLSADGESVTGWRTSSRSKSTECVEVSLGSERVHVRDSKDRDGPVLTFTHVEWRAFLAGVHRGEFDLPPM